MALTSGEPIDENRRKPMIWPLLHRNRFSQNDQNENFRQVLLAGTESGRLDRRRPNTRNDRLELAHKRHRIRFKVQNHRKLDTGKNR